MSANRKVLKPHLAHRKDTWSNGSMEQISLAPGSPEYLAYVRDHSGVDAKDFVQEDVALDAGEDKRPDSRQVPVTEPEHVASFAGVLREKTAEQQAAGVDVTRRKYRLQQAKIDQFPRVKQEAIRRAERTPGKSDDKRAHSADVDDIPDPIQDDGVSEDDFMHRSMRYF